MLEAKASATEALEAKVIALEAERGALKQDRDAVVARSLQSMAAHDSLVGARGGALESAQAGAERALAALREAEGEVARLRSVVGGAEAEAAALRAHAGALAASAAEARAAAAAARLENGEKLLLKTQVAHLQVDNGRLLALLRSTPAYAAVAGLVAPFAVAARAAAAAAAAAARGGGEEDGALAEGDEGPPRRSSYLGSLPGGGEAHYLGGVPPERLSGAEPVVLGDTRGGGGVLPPDRRWDAVPGFEDAYGAFADAVGGGVAPRAGAPEDVDAELEAAQWVPSDAAALCSAFRQRFLQHVSLEDVRALLLGLNLAWRARVEEFIAAARAPLLRRLAEAKRAAALKKPYREVMQSATIARMNTELGALRARAGATAGVAGAAVPISDHDPHGVAFGRTTGARSLSPVRAFLSGVLRGDGGASAAEPREDAPPPGGAEEGGGGGGGGGAGAKAMGLSAALRSAAARLRTGAPAVGGVGQIPELPVALRRVPGSGARRLDAHESAALLESAMAAVEDLTIENRELAASGAALKATVRAQERELVALGVGSSVGGGGGGLGASRAATGLGLTGAATRAPLTATAHLAAAPAAPPQPPGAGAAGAAAAAATAGGFGGAVAALVKSSVGPAAYASLVPPPPHLTGLSKPPAWGYIVTPDGAVAPPLGGSGAFPPPFATVAASRRFTATAGVVGSPAQLAPAAATPGAGAGVGAGLGASRSAPPTPGRATVRRLSVGEAVRAAMGAAVLTVGQLGGSNA